ncbi:MAG: NUDIX hydrolase [Bacteroidota bacterium]
MFNEEVKEAAKAFLEKGAKAYIPQLSVDCVILSFYEDQLRVFLLKPNGTFDYILPGGYVYHEENLDDAAHRVLSERSGLEEIFLKQFHTFGTANRIQDIGIREMCKQIGIDPNLASWVVKRFITVGYYALVNYEKVTPNPDFFSEGYMWADVHHLPKLFADHKHIVLEALDTLQQDLLSQPVGINLLPETFTISDLQKLYECILGRTVDRGNFRKKILKSNVLKKLDEQKKGQPHRSPYLYTFDKEAYHQNLQEEVKIGF